MDPQNQPVQPIPPVVTSRNYLLLGILIVVAALLGSGATYLTLQSKTQNQPEPTPVAQTAPTSIPTPTPDETANWKIYRVEDYGWEFKYPKQVVLEESEVDKMLSLTLKNGENSMKIAPQLKGFGFENPNLDITEEKIEVNGKQVDKMRMFDTQNKTVTYFIMIQYPDNREYSIMIFYHFKDGQEDPQSTKLFDQILSTFKFTP